MVKPKVLGWAGHVDYEKLVEKSEKNKQLNRPKNRRDIEMNLKVGLLRIIMRDVSVVNERCVGC